MAAALHPCRGCRAARRARPEQVGGTEGRGRLAVLAIERCAWWKAGKQGGLQGCRAAGHQAPAQPRDKEAHAADVALAVGTSGQGPGQAGLAEHRENQNSWELLGPGETAAGTQSWTRMLHCCRRDAAVLVHGQGGRVGAGGAWPGQQKSRRPLWRLQHSNLAVGSGREQLSCWAARWHDCFRLRVAGSCIASVQRQLTLQRLLRLLRPAQPLPAHRTPAGLGVDMQTAGGCEPRHRKKRRPAARMQHPFVPLGSASSPLPAVRQHISHRPLARAGRQLASACKQGSNRASTSPASTAPPPKKTLLLPPTQAAPTSGRSAG